MMAGISLAGIVAANDAILVSDGARTDAGQFNDVFVSGVSIDSRQVSAGDVFVALPGARVDGHDFLQQASERGAVAAVVERQQPSPMVQLVVSDSAAALAGIARLNRSAFPGPVIAITGSAGKTTCKNMIAMLLSGRYEICATEGNLNNELGVPLTVCRIEDRHDVAVIEMGAAEKGDIEYLSSIANPTVSVLTNVNEAHIGRFGNLLTTAKTKGEIFTALPDSGVAVLNADDRYADLWRSEIAAEGREIEIIEFSLLDRSADVYLEITHSGESGTTFRVTLDTAKRQEIFDARLPLPGVHNVANAAAAIAVAMVLDIDSEAIAERLLSMQPAPGRMQLREAYNDILLIDDSYNANPQAVEAGAETLIGLSGERSAQAILVLGDMAELGDQSAQKHAETGRRLGAMPIDSLYLVGQYAVDYARGFCESSRLTRADGSNPAVAIFEDKSSLVNGLLDPANRGAVVLVKGSRSSAMEEIANQLCPEPITSGEDR